MTRSRVTRRTYGDIDIGPIRLLPPLELREGGYSRTWRISIDTPVGPEADLIGLSRSLSIAIAQQLVVVMPRLLGGMIENCAPAAPAIDVSLARVEEQVIALAIQSADRSMIDEYQLVAMPLLLAIEEALGRITMIEYQPRNLWLPS